MYRALDCSRGLTYEIHHVVLAPKGLKSVRGKTPMEWMRTKGISKNRLQAIRPNDRISSKVVLENSLFSKYQIYFIRFHPYPSS